MLFSPPKPVSHHCPILLDGDPIVGPSPFRFEKMWIQHKEFNKNPGPVERIEVVGCASYYFIRNLSH